MLLLPVTASSAFADKVYQEPKEFIAEVFPGEVPGPSMLRIVGERRRVASKILDHSPSMLRTRYWHKGNKTAWILEEIGKVKPITAGFVVENGQIKDVRILIYRESHGAEVRHNYFTQQFYGATVNKTQRLTKTVNGISGATLSVSAIKRLATLAVYFDQEARKTKED